MSDTRPSKYECVGVQLFSDENKQYTGRGNIKYARLSLSTQRVTSPEIERTMDLIVNAKGIVNTERKVKNLLRHEGIVIPETLSEMLRNYKN